MYPVPSSYSAETCRDSADRESDAILPFCPSISGCTFTPPPAMWAFATVSQSYSSVPRPRPRPLNPRVPSAVRPLLPGVSTIPAVDGPKMALADEQPEGPAGQTTVAEANG